MNKTFQKISEAKLQSKNRHTYCWDIFVDDSYSYSIYSINFKDQYFISY